MSQRKTTPHTEPRPLRPGYRIELTMQADRLFRNLPRDAQEHLRDALKEVARDPIANGERLKGKFQRFYRTRAGNYRAIYTIKGTKLIVLVVIIGDRKEVYDLLARANLTSV